MSTHSHKINVTFPDAEVQEVELYSVPRIGETVFFDNRCDYKVVGVINHIKKYSGFFGWCGLYRNVITVVLDKTD